MRKREAKRGRVRLAVGGMVLWLCATAGAATHIVLIDGGAFIPEELVINAGDTVHWLAVEEDHTVTSDEGLFDSALLWPAVPTDEIFSYTFTEPGQYGYHCTVHGTPGSGMAGTIYVAEAGVNQPPAAPTNLLPAAGAVNQPLTVQLSASAFADPDPLDFHAASQWVVRRVTDNQLVFDSGEDVIHRVSRTLADGVLSPGTGYVWQVRHRDGRGAWSAYSPATTFTTLVPVSAAGVGLRAEYRNAVNLAPPLVVLTNAIVGFAWGQARPHRRITADEFAVCWEGRVLPQFTERYDVQLQYQGRARVWVDEQLLIDEWAGCAFRQTRRGSISLVGGQLATIRIEYVAASTGAQAVLRWESASQPMEVIPTARLFPPP